VWNRAAFPINVQIHSAVAAFMQTTVPKTM
jgi:hypothetical protein